MFPDFIPWFIFYRPYVFPLILQESLSLCSPKKTKTGCRPFFLIQVDLLMDRKTLSVHLITHERKIKFKPHLHLQNLHIPTFIVKRRPLVERATRFELATPSLGSLYSTTELCPLTDETKIITKINHCQYISIINFDGGRIEFSPFVIRTIQFLKL